MLMALLYFNISVSRVLECSVKIAVPQILMLLDFKLFYGILKTFTRSNKSCSKHNISLVEEMYHSEMGNHWNGNGKWNLKSLFHSYIPAPMTDFLPKTFYVSEDVGKPKLSERCLMFFNVMLYFMSLHSMGGWGGFVNQFYVRLDFTTKLRLNRYPC